jgi:hypothetical protein
MSFTEKFLVIFFVYKSYATNVMCYTSRKNILNAAAIRIISGLMEKYENVKRYCLNLNSTIMDKTNKLHGLSPMLVILPHCNIVDTHILYGLQGFTS